MAGGQQQGGGGGGDNSLDFLWGICLVIAFVLAIWYFGRIYVVDFIYTIRYYEVILINWGLTAYLSIAGAIGLPFPDTQDLYAAVSAINQGATNNTPFGVVADVSTAVGWYLTFPISLILALLAFAVLNSNVGAKFKRVHNMDTLRKSELSLWPMITPIHELNLIKEDINKGPWAMSLPPMMFAKSRKLIKDKKEPGKVTATVIRGRASRVFALQLGPYFTSVDKLPIHTQAIFAVCAARAMRDRSLSDKILDQISRSAATKKLDFTGVTEAALKHINTKEVQYVMVRHAYVTTMMATMLELARQDGVMATSEFLWLKPVDRRLWYTLNSVGRQTPFPEVAGIFAHWRVEKKLGRPMKTPMIDEAVSALEKAMSEIIYEPDED